MNPSYEVDVSHNGKHFFKTGTDDLSAFIRILNKFRRKFPDAEGYEVRACRLEPAHRIPLDINIYID